MGKGVGRVWRPPAPRVERTRPTGPSSTSFNRFWLDKGSSTVQKRFSMMARAVEGAPDCAPHPAHAPYLTHACARATQVPGNMCLCRRERSSSERESSRERRVGDGAGKRSSEAGRAHAGDGVYMGCEGAVGKYIGKMQHDRAEHAWLEKTALPLWGVSRSRKRAGCLTTSTSVEAPMSPSFSPPIPHFMV